MLIKNICHVFLKIGAFTFGGGYAMLPVIQREVVQNRNWLTEDEYYQVIGVSQSGPGAVAINTAIYLGYKIKGIGGSLAGALGVVLPSFLIILALATFFKLFFCNGKQERAFFMGIRPAVVGLLASVTYKMTKKITSNSQWILFLFCLALLIFFSVHPALIILICAVYGAIFSKN